MDPIPIATRPAGAPGATRPAGAPGATRPAGAPGAARADEAGAAPARDDHPARVAAEAFEAAFIAEMLDYGGVNKTPAAFGGGAGEDAFGSFLTREYARLIAANGGLGLAEQIFEAIKQKAPAP